MPLASGIGSWPGESAREAIRTVAELLAATDLGLTYLPETPGRGPGADMIGRAAGLLVDMPVDLQPSGWRLVDSPGRDVRRAQGFLREDLDELAETYDGWTGTLKIQVAGPWTLAASVALPRGERAVHDPGAARDLTGSLAEGLRTHCADIARLVPGGRLVVQVDEPSLPAVLDGRLPTASGFSRLPAVERETAQAALADVLAAVPADAETLVHCCAPEPPIGLIRAAGAAGVALDLSILPEQHWEALGEAVEAGTRLWAGVVGTDGGQVVPDRAVAPLLASWERLGLAADHLADVVLTPGCGMPGLTRAAAVRAQRGVVEAADLLTDRLE